MDPYFVPVDEVRSRSSRCCLTRGQLQRGFPVWKRREETHVHRRERRDHLDEQHAIANLAPEGALVHGLPNLVPFLCRHWAEAVHDRLLRVQPPSLTVDVGSGGLPGQLVDVHGAVDGLLVIALQHAEVFARAAHSIVVALFVAGLIVVYIVIGDVDWPVGSVARRRGGSRRTGNGHPWAKWSSRRKTETESLSRLQSRCRRGRTGMSRGRRLRRDRGEVQATRMIDMATEREERWWMTVLNQSAQSGGRTERCDAEPSCR
ncbi:hypothetical protein BDZ90DRAFT_182359 [Jaminaea rosea]|uniref:Uncharacterized protein n=1 Tax=Jaminaea rosea TaxID=1569628 RepID=A0A316UQK4_9BASI|nr:hypothetical protein BDZ90DRAFT_182359 [Jaminaea rosea]PWN27570.1 hypothetical protein BDZ90DRAFT_182359 [Jaminaea rosea]